MEQSKQKKKSESEITMEKKNRIYRLLPRVDELMRQKKVQQMVAKEGYDRIRSLVRQSVDQLRNEITGELSRGISEKDAKEKIEQFLRSLETGFEKTKVEDLLAKEKEKAIHPVYNGTGVILHTGLGRAPLSHEIAEKLGKIAENYSSLEYDLPEGKRGNRTEYIEELLCQITGAEAALAVNNNAGAVLLALSALTKGGEVIVSRGELVEIGGKFRIPEVLELSGATLREVGTTNRTRIEDYERAVDDGTKAFLKVHASNYRIIGFTESVSAGKLKELSQKLAKEEKRIPVIEDLGSGVLVDLQEYGLGKEPTVQEEVKAGADLICFSADKLLGGAQAGLIVGKKSYVDQMRNHPLLRALRIDKFARTALEAVLKEYLDLKQAVQTVPVLQMLTCPVQELQEKAVRCCARLDQEGIPVRVQVETCVSKAGGGALPELELPSYGVSLLPEEIKVEALEERMRRLPVPVIGRVKEGRFLLDMRTFSEEGIKELEEQLAQLAEK